MKNKVVTTLTVLVLVILPFLLSIAIGKYSPYIETNSFQTYVTIWAVISIAIVSIVLRLFKRFYQLLGKISVCGILLFLLLIPLVGIYGLASAPDLSLKMLEHPEREHLRYILLFVAAILFSGFIFFLIKNNSLGVKKSTIWILAMALIVALAEFLWEFKHHYLYPEAMKEWISQGKTAEEFGKNYDNTTIINTAVLGRFIQFSLIIWLSLKLYKLRQIKIWNPILSIFFSLLGIVSATLVYITKFNFPKGFEILMLFFIPGISFFLLYWLGVALLTNFKQSKTAT